jgi:hypothetical protein
MQILDLLLNGNAARLQGFAQRWGAAGSRGLYRLRRSVALFPVNNDFVRLGRSQSWIM